MIHNDYDLIICSTPRLAQSIKRYHAKINPKTISLTPNTQILNNWLDTHMSRLLILGEMPPDTADFYCLSNFEERLLWQQVIKNHLKDNPYQDLFDVNGLANAAIEANNYVQIWQIHPKNQQHNLNTEESKQFILWQKAFNKICSEKKVLEKCRYVAWQIKQISLFPILLPRVVAIAGYDRIDPQIQSFIDCLTAHDCIVEIMQTPSVTSSMARIMYSSSDEECRAAVAWAKQQLECSPSMSLAIIVPELKQLREQLIDLLDDTFHPETVIDQPTEIPRCYELSLGIALNKHPLVNITLRLLKLFSRTHRLSLVDYSLVLLANFWSAEHDEESQRALLDAELRRHLPLTLTWPQLLRFIESTQLCPQLLKQCKVALAFVQQFNQQQLPSNWIITLNTLLQKLDWPGQRNLNSHEYQAQQAFLTCLTSLKKLDDIVGKTSLANMIYQLNQLSSDQIFQPRTLNQPSIQVLGLLEATAAQCDGAWVMGMTDDHWPPAPRLNPLLSASLQRNLGTPNADHHTQLVFANQVHSRLKKIGKQVIFSWAEKDGDKLLRISPMIADLPEVAQLPPIQYLGEALMPAEGFAYEALEDNTAPAVTKQERVKGGTALFKAQAICPAWGYYQFRLGAKKLQSPKDGLDASTRGSLAHLALQHFWQNQDSLSLKQCSEAFQFALVTKAVQSALSLFNHEHGDILSPNMLQLETTRLVTLLKNWLIFELTREVEFSVLDCEKSEMVEIEGINVKLSIDRIDVLSDNTKVIIDYKTGHLPKLKNWADLRIKEPQLPIYATMALKDGAISAVVFAHIKRDSEEFSGVARVKNILPKILAIGDEQLKEFSSIPTWDALLNHWQNQIKAIALEIKFGVANVTFEDENDLIYCEVLPLLRLPERALQFERFKKK